MKKFIHSLLPNTTRFVSLFQRPSMTMKSQTASLTLYFANYKNTMSSKLLFVLLKNRQSGKPQPDINEIKKQIRREERQNLQKKNVLGRRVEVEFERVNAGFKLCLTKERMLNYK